MYEKKICKNVFIRIEMPPLTAKGNRGITPDWKKWHPKSNLASFYSP
jgi:hypothetical protein